MMIASVMEKMVGHFGHDARRINHALKVFAFTQIISSHSPLDVEVQEIIAYAALLHDIGIPEAERKYPSSAGQYQQIEGPQIARQILTDLGISVLVIDRVCFIIGNHHTYTKIDGIDFQILVEADFLVNIFEEGLPREAAAAVSARIFKTNAGRNLLRSMYLD
jgi:HD superfamily phosphodiesterase